MSRQTPKTCHFIALAVGLTAGCVHAEEASTPHAVGIHATQRIDQPRDIGRLRLISVLELQADDAAFGGFSGMAISPAGDTLHAVSDRGHWLRLDLVHDSEGRLQSLGQASMGPLRDVGGKPVDGRMMNDAEELVDTGDAWLVTFEGAHRIWRYAKVRSEPGIRSLPVPLAHPHGMRKAEKNGGMEAMTLLADNRLLVLTESLFVRGFVRGWVGGIGRRWSKLRLVTTDAFRPTGLTRLPNGDVILLERSYAPETGVRIRLSRLAGGVIRPGAVLESQELARMDPSWPIDNLESVAARELPHGAVSIYLLSDDNFSKEQRTLLLQLILDPDDSGEALAGRRAPTREEAAPWLGQFVAGDETIAFAWQGSGLVFSLGAIDVPVDGSWHETVTTFAVRHRVVWHAGRGAVVLEERHHEGHPWRYVLELAEGGRVVQKREWTEEGKRGTVLRRFERRSR